MMKKDIVTIQAVYEGDLKSVLKKLKLWKELQKGELKCFACGKTMTYENVGGLKKVSGKVRLLCDNLLCITK